MGTQTSAIAQNATLSSGKDIRGESGSVSYSIGQVFYSTINGNGGNINQGVQQPYEISVFTEAKEFKHYNLKCTAYPNPTNDYLHIKTDENYDTQLDYRIVNMDGRLFKSGKVTGTLTTISMYEFSPSIYLLQIFMDQTNIKTFKIIKH
jgi:hypothetical protein